jgi:hypothetical protein
MPRPPFSRGLEFAEYVIPEKAVLQPEQDDLNRASLMDIGWPSSIDKTGWNTTMEMRDG